MLNCNGRGKRQKVAAAKFQSWLQLLGWDELVVYIDGSLKKDLMRKTIDIDTAWVLQ